jgi:hypothetical protein
MDLSIGVGARITHGTQKVSIREEKWDQEAFESEDV